MRRALAGLLAGAAAAAAGGAALPGAASAELPAGTAYELVSPLAARGVDVSTSWVWGDGDVAMLGSWTADPRGLSVARRTASGWQVERRDMTPPDAWIFFPPTVVDGTDDLARTILKYNVKPNIAPDQLAIREPDGSWAKVGGGVSYAGSSADARRVVVVPYPGVGAPPYPEIEEPTGVFLWDDGRVSAIGGDDPGVAACGAIVADGGGNGAIAQNGVAADGRSVVLTSNACGAAQQHVLLWRDGVTRDLSAPAAGELDGAASYVGNAADGSAVFFRTALALDPADANGAEDVYRYDVASGARTRVTGAATDAGAALTSAISSDDGARLWFATSPTAEDDELWVWSDGGGAARIAQAHDADGSAPDPFAFQRTPGWTSTKLTQVTPDGSAIAWLGNGRLAGNAAGREEAFRATAAGDVACVSCVAAGGDDLTAQAAQFGSPPTDFAGPMRSMSDDGRSVFFQTLESHDSLDWNGAYDVYRWRDGALTLISSGERGFDALLSGVSPRGDVFFNTTAKLLPWIDDEHRKVYVARAGGGLPAPVDPTASCSGDACQGDPVAQPRSAPAGSEEYRGAGDVEQPEPPTAAIGLAKVTAAAKRRLARGGTLTLAVRATTAGRVTGTLRVRAGRRWVRAGSAGRTLARGGTARLTLRLSRAARGQLARHGSLRVRIDVAQTGGALPRSATFTLKQTKGRGR